MNNRVFIVLLILMAISACVSIPSQIKNSFEELSSLNSKQYLGGLNQQQLLLAEKIIKHMRPEFEWIQCPENNQMNGEIVGSFEVIDEPSNSFISNEDLQVLQSNISSGNQLVRDLSLYIVAKLGPAG